MTLRYDPMSVLHMLPDFARGGGQIQLLRSLQTKPLDRWRHILCGLGPGPMEEAFRSAGVETTVIRCQSFWAVPKSLLALIGLIHKEKIAIIHTNNTPRDRVLGQFAARHARIPVVNTFHAEPRPPIRFHGFRQIPSYVERHAVYMVNRALVRMNVARMTAVSSAIRESHAKALRLDPADIDIIHPGLLPSAFDAVDQSTQEALRLSLGLDGSWPILISVGRLEANKGQRIWLPVVAQLQKDWPRICLILVGDGPDRLLIEQEAAQLGLESAVLLLGQREDVTALLGISDVYVSASAKEGFGIAVLEAMAASKPVVLSDLPAYREFVTDRVSGVLVPARDSQALAKALRSLLSEPESMLRMGAAGRCAAQDFTVDRSAAQLHAVYESVLSAAV